MASAHCRLLEQHLGVWIPADPIEAAVQGNPSLQLVVQMDGEDGAGALSHGCGRL